MIYEEEVGSLIVNEAKGKKIILMGRMEHLRIINEIILSMGEKVWRIWDNDNNKQGGAMGNILIEAPCSGLLAAFIIIYSPKHWQAMYDQVLSLGYDKTSVFVLDRPSFERNRRMLAKGFEVYKKVCDVYGADARVFLTSGPLGDYYLLGLFFHEYCRVNGIKNCVIAGDSKGIGRLSEFLELSPACELSPYDTAALGELWKFADGNINIKPLTLWQGDFRFNPCVVRQLPKFTFMDTFRSMIFNLPMNTKPRYPKWKYNFEMGKKLFAERNLQRDKTVLLVPFAYSMVSMPREFWQRLSAMLQNKGYTVLTNTFGENEKNFIDNAFDLSLDFPDTMDFMQYGATVMGIRCGFFDITSQAECKRIVLYPPKSSGNISWQRTDIDFCGLKVMGLCDDAYEWEVKNVDEIMKKILSIL